MSRILIVDDSMFMRNILKTILNRIGHEVVGEGKDGFEAILKYSELQPDVLFLDITMPNLNGIGALREIMKNNNDVNVIMCSAMGQTAYIYEAISLGAKDFIVKPFNTDRVEEAISKILK